MLLLNPQLLARLARKHPDAGKPTVAWAELAKLQDWKSISDVRRTFATADGVPVKVKGGGVVVATVFNIKGNAYRLITIVSYVRGTIDLREFLTHAEYSKNDWRGRL